MPPPPPSIIRVIDLETTGSAPPAHGVCEIGWQDVALSQSGRWELFGEGGQRFVNPGRPMSPITTAIHHIRDEDVADAPWWHDVARPILDPWPRRVALAAHRATFEEQFCTPSLTRGADWICTWKCALRLWPDSPSFSNQVLRYWRKPEGLEHERGLPAHRAFPDAYVTAFHLRDMLNEASVAQLIEWSKLPGLLPRVRYGPDRGKEWSEIDDDSLHGFLSDRDIDIRFTAETEYRRRLGGGPVGRTPENLLL
ncbi:exonuclease domain-containing protein [Sphingomonas sp. G-3-2-10]|jgi:exodeoxyribonuclease X|uniref:exonuclease domain-containing protein n=1 Tax=Sphingomonas sp. G-3-2-10 TaxID=2728838 RepID=UPI00146E93CE|nr:exonuclease domain-containing protein [Sphingomonas sp. G-3-2-10]NML06825.1 3'-5' exonuclease [Sphingomonas sp. G-3-2-10]